MKKNLTTIILLTLYILILQKATFSSTIQCSKAYVQPEECFNLYFMLNNTDNITSTIITFTFDPGKMQIGCNENFNSDNSEIYTFDTNTDELSTELPIILSDSLVQQNFKCKLAIHPEGVFTVAIWGGNTAIPPGIIFSVPAKLLPSAQIGDILPIILPSEANPAIVERTFDEEEKSIPLYCSFTNIEAVPIYPKMINGAVYVGIPPEAETDGETTEGHNEGTIEGTGEGPLPEGTIDGETPEGDNEGTIEGTAEGSPDNEKPSTSCGCGKSSSYNISADYLIVIVLVAMLSATKKKDTKKM